MVLPFWFYFRLINVGSQSCLCELSKVPKESPEDANHNLAVVGFGERKLLKQYKVGFSIAGHNVQNLQHLYLEDAVLLYTVDTDPSCNPYKELGLILSTCLTTDGRTTKAHPFIPLQTYYTQFRGRPEGSPLLCSPSGTLSAITS